MNRLTTTGAAALYHFDRTLEDLGPNGLDLTASGGSAAYVELAPNHFGLAPGSDVRRPSWDAALALTGPCTVEVTGWFYATPSGAIFASFTTSGETLATNTLWQLGAHTASQLRWIQESGAGVDAAHLSTGALEAMPRPWTRFHAAAVRDSGGVVRLYLNGRQHGSASAALTAPTGGTSAFLRVMFGSTNFALDGLKICASALSASDVADSASDVLGYDVRDGVFLTQRWVGAVTDTTATIVVRANSPIVVEGVATDADNVARIELTGLTADTAYEVAGCSFRTHPAPAGDPVSFTVAFGGDNDTGSAHRVWDAIRALDPLQFIQLGDWGYANPNNTAPNAPALYHVYYDANLASYPQARLFRSVPTQHVWDDHDYSHGNSDSTSPSRPAAAAVYRSREPHYPLPDATAIYQTWDIGRVRFVLTDQRSEASPGSMADGPSKSMLGATQKAWFKDLIANSPGKLIVWICPRWFAHANHTDSWNSFAMERAELCDHIKANAHGRVVVLEADQHTGAIDDGSHVDHATGGGEPLRCFRAAPLDRTPSALANTYSHGEFNSNNQFGTMQVTDTGGASIAVDWTLLDSAGTVLTSYSFTVAV